MKVLMLSDVYFPRVNGVSTSIRTFRQSLPEQGVTVDVLAPAYPWPAWGARHDGASEAERPKPAPSPQPSPSGRGRDAAPAAQNGHAEWDDPGVKRVSSRYLPFDPEDRLMKWRPLMQSLAREIDQDYQLIHLQTPFVAHYAGLKLAKRLGVPAITTYHTLFEEYLHLYAPGLPAGAGRWLARQISRSQCNQTQGVIAPSRLMHDTLRRYGVTVPIEVIPTGIPLAEFSDGDGVGFRAQHGIGPQRQVALFVGRVAFEKNIELLIHVADRIRQRLPSFLLLIAGEGPAENALRKLVNKLELHEHVQFVGYLDRQTALPDCYAAADVFTFSSVTETQGLVLLEAMAMGLPVVGIPAMGARDILGPERGCLCASNDADDFTEKLFGLLQRPSLRRALAQDARDYARSWGAPAMAERMARFYRRVVREQAARKGADWAMEQV